MSPKPYAVSVREAGRLQGLGRSSVYEQIERGELEAFKDGTRTLVTVESIERRQANLPRVKPKAKG